MRAASFWFLVFDVFFILNDISGQYFSYPKNNPVELGKVNWIRDYDRAISLAVEKKLPILILFQEVPGCSNCTTFGNEILSDPLIAEAIESCFIPLCIYNNIEGPDRKVLNKYNEPTWNNPVVRIIDNGGQDLIPRLPDFRKKHSILSGMTEAISKSGRIVPEYLKMLKEEAYSRELGELSDVYFSMFCFWSGEKEIGGIDGVISTEAGYMNGHEVVKIEYRKDKITLDQLYKNASGKGCGDAVFGSVNAKTKLTIKPTGKYTKDSEDKYYLLHSPYKSIPMTELQKMKVNRALAFGEKPDYLLSPRQLSVLNYKNKEVSHISDNIMDAWWISLEK